METNCPKVSIIIPVYNVEKYLKKCLDSVINQTLKDIEIICIDDGSTDSSCTILNEYAQKDNRFVILKQENSGAGAARNKGIEVAKGEYLYFLDSDDFINKVLLEKTHNKIKENNSDICIFKTYYYNSETKKQTTNLNWEIRLNRILNRTTFNANDIPNEIFLIFTIPAFTKLYKTSFIKNNKINFQEIKTCNDVFFNFYTLSKANKITFLNEYLVTYRTAQLNNLSANRNKSIECINSAFKFLKEKLIEDNLYELLKITYYKRYAWAVEYEINLLPTKNLKREWCEQLLKDVPKKYWTPNLLQLFENKTTRFLKRIFSITYHEKNLFYSIYILGINIKIRRKICQK